VSDDQKLEQKNAISIESSSDKKRGRFEEGRAESPEEREARLHATRMANLALGNGRPKGTPNRVTKTIREAILQATQPGECHPEGLVGWLRDRAQGGIEDRKIFGAMVSRALPIEVTGTDGGPIKIDLGWMSQRRIGYGDVVDVIPVTQTPQQLGQAADNTVQSMPYAGGAPDVISADAQDKEDKA
jgi:hypothetical protein